MKKIFAAAAAVTALLYSQYSPGFSTKVHINYANLIIENLKKNGGNKLELIAPAGQKKYWVQLDSEDAQAILGSPLYFRGGAVGPDNTLFSGLTDPSHSPAFKPYGQCHWLYTRAAKAAQAARSAIEAKTAQDERAYALGCFLHGISDNVAHHIVNYMAQQTFTLNPNLKAKKGTELGLELQSNPGLQTSAINVFNHILTEKNFEKSFQTKNVNDPNNPFTKERLNHEMATSLYQRVYLPTVTYQGMNDVNHSAEEPSTEDYYFSKLYEGYQRKKLEAISKVPLKKAGNDYVTEATDIYQNKDFRYLAQPIRQTQKSVEENKTRARKPDRALIGAYVNFIKGHKKTVTRQNGEKVTIEVGGLEPYGVILMLPAIVHDVKKFLDLLQIYRESSYKWCNAPKNIAVKAWRLVQPECIVTNVLFDDESKTYRLAAIIDRKQKQLDAILPAHMQTLENLSVWLNTHDKIKSPNDLDPKELEKIFKPTQEAFDQISNITLEDLFTAMPELNKSWKMWIAKEILESLQDLLVIIKEHTRERLLAALKHYTDQVEVLNKEIANLRQAVNEQLNKTIIGDFRRYRDALKEMGMDALHDRLGEEKESLLALESEDSAVRKDAYDRLLAFSSSVGHMNAFNSIAAVLANQKVVNPLPAELEQPQKGLRVTFQGPVSFDASFQLEYNQLALCDGQGENRGQQNLREIFYPCGTTAAEMLQPGGYAKCVPFPLESLRANPGVSIALNPPAECYRWQDRQKPRVNFEFALNPTPQDCNFTQLEDVQKTGAGSYTLSFPPHLTPQALNEVDQPKCRSIEMKILEKARN